MPSPTPYRRSFSFTDYQAANPSSPDPGNEIDAQMNAIKVATNSVISNLGLIQQTNGQLANASVGYQQLQRCVRRDLNPPTSWSSSAVSCFPGDLVFYRPLLYVCNTANVSSASAPPSTNAAWTLLANFSSLPPGSVMAADLAPGAVTLAALGPNLALPSSPATGDSSTAIATTSFVQATIAALGGSLPTSLPATAGALWVNSGVLSIS